MPGAVLIIYFILENDLCLAGDVFLGGDLADKLFVFLSGFSCGLAVLVGCVAGQVSLVAQQFLLLGKTFALRAIDHGVVLVALGV